MRNKQVVFNPYIYTWSKLYRFGYENRKYPFFNTKHPVIILRGSLFVVTPAHVASWKMDVKIFLMFIVAENTRSVNIGSCIAIEDTHCCGLACQTLQYLIFSHLHCIYIIAYLYRVIACIFYNCSFVLYMYSLVLYIIADVYCNLQVLICIVVVHIYIV